MQAITVQVIPIADVRHFEVVVVGSARRECQELFGGQAADTIGGPSSSPLWLPVSLPTTPRVYYNSPLGLG